MPNQILNASFLDGLTGFSAAAGLALDSSVAGADARPVMVGTTYVISDPVLLDGASGVYAFGQHDGGRLTVRFLTPGGEVDFDLPLIRAPSGPGRRGIASTFSLSRGYVAAPVGATAWRLFADTATTAALFRPYGAGQTAAASRACRWAPGPHLNPDLDVPSWPEALPNPDPDSFELEPIPRRKAFTGDDGVPTTRRVSNLTRRFARFGITLDAVGRDVLEQFWRSNVEEFFFVRPDNGDLCLAEWAEDGDPSDNGGKPGSRSTTLRILIREA